MEGCSVQALSSVSAINSSPRAPNYQPRTFPRRTANFHPSVWGDHFLKYASHDDPPKVHAFQSHKIFRECIPKFIYYLTQKV